MNKIIFDAIHFLIHNVLIKWFLSELLLNGLIKTANIIRDISVELKSCNLSSSYVSAI